MPNLNAGKSMAQIKAENQAKRKAEGAALAREESVAASADGLWTSAFDFVFDATKPSRCELPGLPPGRTVLVFVPGFASWSALTTAHVSHWKGKRLLQPEAGAGGGGAEAPRALSIAFKWNCGDVRWNSPDAMVEAAAAWEGAHAAAAPAAVRLAALLRFIRGNAKCRVLLVAHSLGARVALLACADARFPSVSGLVLLGAAVDNSALNEGPEAAVPDAAPAATAGAAAAPVERASVLSRCAVVTVVHSARDEVLANLWPAAEYARCGRQAPPALGLTGPDPPLPHGVLTPVGGAMAQVLDVTAAGDQEAGWDAATPPPPATASEAGGSGGLGGSAGEAGEAGGDAGLSSHDPAAYLTNHDVEEALKAVLFPQRLLGARFFSSSSRATSAASPFPPIR